jgi:hypothetical protein
MYREMRHTSAILQLASRCKILTNMFNVTIWKYRQPPHAWPHGEKVMPFIPAVTMILNPSIMKGSNSVNMGFDMAFSRQSVIATSSKNLGFCKEAIKSHQRTDAYC